MDLDEFENFHVGIISSMTDFKKKKMRNLLIKPLPNNGYLAYGVLEFPISTPWFEYKYMLSFNQKSSDKSYLIEFLGTDKNREFKSASRRNQSVISIYDGIMLPPDKASESFVETLKTTVKKLLRGTYFNESFYDEYKDETIKAMFHEIKTSDETKFKTLDSATNYLDDVIQGLKTNFKDKNMSKVG